MTSNEDERLRAILKEYSSLPEYSGMGIPSINTRSLFGNYPINIAAVRGLHEEVSLLLSHGADVNIQGEHGYTPLHEAVEQGHIEIVELLLKHGASPSAKSEDDVTPIELAAMLKEQAIYTLLSTVGK